MLIEEVDEPEPTVEKADEDEVQEEESEEIDVDYVEKKPSILMKENESSPSKKNVKFRMEDNKVKEFYKNEKIVANKSQARR